MFRVPLLLGFLLALSACGSPQRQFGQPASLECVPFARALSGVSLRGDAADWWWRADGRYARGRVPQNGAVIGESEVSLRKRLVDQRRIQKARDGKFLHRVARHRQYSPASREHRSIHVAIERREKRELSICERDAHGISAERYVAHAENSRAINAQAVQCLIKLSRRRVRALPGRRRPFRYGAPRPRKTGHSAHHYELLPLSHSPFSHGQF